MQRFVPSGNTINRAYTSPTCSLEVWAKRSPMSAWTSQTVVQNLRFRLRLAQGKVIKGNQSQINRIIEAVIAYSDRWLAQDEIDNLDHAIAIPEGAKLQLSTLQLFDLYETLEQCSSELVILPDVVLEVRRLTPNWLKIMAAAIALIGISIGAVRLVSRDQPSLQIASTPNPLPPEVAPPSISDRQDAAKRSPQVLPASPDTKIPAPQPSQPSEAASRPVTPEIAPLLPQTGVIAPKSSMPEGSDRAIPSLPPNLQIGATRRESPVAKSSIPENNAPSTLANGQVTDQATDQAINQASKQTSNQTSAIPEASDNLPSIASAPLSRSSELPNARLPSANVQIANVQIANVQIANVRSQLPETIQTELIKHITDYLKQLDRQAIFLSRNYVIEMQVIGDQIVEIVIEPTPINIGDRKDLEQLQQAIKAWRLVNASNGRMKLELVPRY